MEEIKQKWSHTSTMKTKIYSNKSFFNVILLLLSFLFKKLSLSSAPSLCVCDLCEGRHTNVTGVEVRGHLTGDASHLPLALRQSLFSFFCLVCELPGDSLISASHFTDSKCYDWLIIWALETQTQAIRLLWQVLLLTEPPVHHLNWVCCVFF